MDSFFENVKALVTKSAGDQVEAGFKARYGGFLERNGHIFDPKRICYGVRISKLPDYVVQVTVSAFYVVDASLAVAGGLRAQRDVYYVSGGGADYALEYYNVIRFTISPYPSCCGLRMFHTFHHSNHINDQKIFDDVMEEVLKLVHNRTTSLYASRLEAVFVRIGAATRPRSRKTEEVQIKDTDSFFYPMFRQFFLNKAEKVESRSFYNYNSGNLLEKSEALFAASWFAR